MNDKKSVADALGKKGNAALQALLQKLQNNISNKFKQVTTSEYFKLLGLNQTNDGNIKTANVQQPKKVQPLGLRYNNLPAEDRETIEISELAKNFRGTPIGVASADIFRMIKKRYNIKSSQKMFLSPEIQNTYRSQFDK